MWCVAVRCLLLVACCLLLAACCLLLAACCLLLVSCCQPPAAPAFRRLAFMCGELSLSLFPPPRARAPHLCAMPAPRPLQDAGFKWMIENSKLGNFVILRTDDDNGGLVARAGGPSPSPPPFLFSFFHCPDSFQKQGHVCVCGLRKGYGYASVCVQISNLACPPCPPWQATTRTCTASW
jgi:hypothetical protein